MQIKALQHPEPVHLRHVLGTANTDGSMPHQEHTDCSNCWMEQAFQLKKSGSSSTHAIADVDPSPARNQLVQQLTTIWFLFTNRYLSIFCEESNGIKAISPPTE